MTYKPKKYITRQHLDGVISRLKMQMAADADATELALACDLVETTNASPLLIKGRVSRGNFQADIVQKCVDRRLSEPEATAINRFIMSKVDAVINQPKGMVGPS